MARGVRRGGPQAIDVKIESRGARPPVPQGRLRCDVALPRVTACDLFADLTDNSARAEVVSARVGYLTLPPTAPMPELSPVLELQGTLETEHQRYDFTRYVAAVAPGDRDRDRKVTNAHPALVIA